MSRTRLMLATIIAILSSFVLHAQVNHLVISQVYGGGGNSGANYKNDFIEIFNPTNATVSVNGWSVQYASATGNSWQVTFLAGDIAPGKYYLVQEAAGTGGTSTLPTPDKTGTINMSGTAGKVALVSSTTALTGTCPTAVVDLVGFGTTANCSEGNAPTPAPSNANSVMRNNNGCTDTDNNGADFTAAAAAPRNSASPANFCTTCTAPTNQPTALTFTPAVTSISGSFTAADAGTTPAAGYLVLISSSTTLTSQPANNTAYTAGETIGNATVVSAGTSTTFTTANNLAAGTSYNFFVYSYSATNCYNITTPLTATAATLGAPKASVAAGTNASEPSTNGTFLITLTSAAPAGGVTINYSLGGTATLGTDYGDGQNGTITVAEGATTATLTLTTLDDATAEPTKTIDITLNGISAPYALETTTASISLTDDDVEPVSFTGSYSQDFNTLATTGTSTILPTGWILYETGTNANRTYAVTDGAANSGNTYSFGTTASTERALGGIRSSSLIPSVGAIFTNNTGSTVSSLNITYTGEQWRLGATNRFDRLDFQFSTNATDLSNGTWIDVDALDFNALNGAGTAGALDGNGAANRKTITYTISGLSIPAGSNFLIRWNDLDASGADDGLAVDDLSITLGCTAPTNQPTSLTLTPTLQSITGSFTPAAAGSKEADEYLVVMSTSPTLTLPPASGTVYAIDDEIGNGVVVGIGNSTSFTASNLTPGTTYYFFVYAVASATSCYNITAPLTASAATTTPPPCTPPATQATAFTATNITGSSMTIGYTRGNGANILVLARAASAVTTVPTNGINYAVGAQVGSGNFVVYNGSASSFNYTGLTQNTTYHFAAYEYASTTYCYTTPALVGSFSTICSTPVNVSSVTTAAGNGQATINWTNPVAGCFDQVIVVVSTSPITAQGSTFTGTANPAYTGGTQLVYRGTTNSVVVSGLTNGTTYFIKVFGKLGTAYSDGVQANVTPYDPATGFQYLYGNLHAHSSYSDGNKDDLTKTPKEDFLFARDAQCMDFMGMSEHNHSTAGLNIANYKKGYTQADEVNMVPGTTGNSIVTLFGMEWGVISGGGHVLVYGFDDKLLGWETANYDIYVAKSDYPSLWTAVNSKQGAIATLAHPNSTDYGNIASKYNEAADNAIYGVAVASGPAFSTSKTYNDFPSSLSYLNYYKTMLSKGYHLAPQMDQDNHNMTFGTANTNRMVVLATTKTREGIMDAIRNMRYYASEDCNLQVAFTAAGKPMGSSITGFGAPTLSIAATDVLPADETVTSIELWGGPTDGSVPATLLKTFANTSTAAFGSADAENIQPNNSTYYYFSVITQGDGNRAVTAPIWYTRVDVAPPVTFASFTGAYSATDNVVNLAWETALEFDSKEFVIERAPEGSTTWTAIGTVKAAGSSTQARQYSFTDKDPQMDRTLYRLRQVNNDGKAVYSNTVTIQIVNASNPVYKAYPNPAVGFTRIYSSNDVPENVAVRIIDAHGRVVKMIRANINSSTPYRLGLEEMQSGVYLLQIEGASKRTEKLIISK